MDRLVTVSVWAHPVEAWRVESYAHRCTYIPGRFSADPIRRLVQMRDSFDPGVRATYEAAAKERDV
jgi:hypothetical protein